ncbi:MAG: hypothetical protein A2505_01660 [Deltaproteobacteria bacterium RIFOXYD12_FULL_55_16]|nr:MAG: hypothetical protein A2505_01660 [Deltaproteobacteria bacterium RIFOXYD12_FULL_55_16]
MAHHIFGHENRDELFTIMHSKSNPNHVRNYIRTPGPSLDNLSGAFVFGLHDLRQQMVIYKWTFFN